MDRSFFLPRTSGLHALNPLTKLVLVLAIVAIGFLARWAWLAIALVVFVVAPIAAWGRILRPLALAAAVVVLPFAISVFVVQGLFLPGAVHSLIVLGPLTVKQEGVALAAATTARILVLASALLLLLFSTHPADLMLALERRGLPSPLTYMIVSALQLIPQMQSRAGAILDAQRARGLETQGSIVVRTRALIPLLVPLVMHSLVQADERAMALDARAFAVRRVKTSYRELRDTRGQVWLRRLIVMGTLVVAVLEIAVT